MRKLLFLAVCIALAAVVYFKVAPTNPKKGAASNPSRGFLSEATGIPRALEAKQAALEMKKKLEEDEARKQAEYDAASDENGVPAAKPRAPEMEPAKPSE